MTVDNQSDQNKQGKVKRKIIFIVIPALLIIAGLIITGVVHLTPPTAVDIKMTQSLSVKQILDSTQIKCYNINWFGSEGTGFQVVFKDSIEEIKSKLRANGIPIEVDEQFFKVQMVVDHLIRVCPHLDNRDQIPQNFDQKIGVNALDKCMERKKNSEYCNQFNS